MFWKRRNTQNDREALHASKLRESQEALLSAATTTANAAHDVTILLKNKLIDAATHLNATTHIVEDALLLCDMNGKVLSYNPAATELLGIQEKGVDLFRLVDLPTHFEHLQPRQKAMIPDGTAVLVKMEQLDWSDGTSSKLVLVRLSREGASETV